MEFLDNDLKEAIMMPESHCDNGAPEKDHKSPYWSRFERRLWTGTLFCGSTMIYASRTIMPLCAVAIAADQGWDKKESGTVLSTFFWGYALTQVLGGYLSDRIGGDSVIMYAGAGWTLITFITPLLVYTSSHKGVVIAVVCVSRVLLGAMQGVHYPSVTSLLAKNVPEVERAFSYAVVASGSRSGTLVCGSVGSVLLHMYGWPSVFYFFGFLGMSWIVLLRYLIGRERAKSRQTAHNSLSSQIKYGVPFPWRKLLKQPALWALLIGHFCSNNSFFILLSWLPTYFHETFPEAKGWVFNVVPWFFAVPSSICGGLLADHLVARGYSITVVRKLLASITLGGVGSFLLLLNYTSSYMGALFCMTASIACSAFSSGGINVNPQDIAPRFAGSVYGIMNTAGSIPGFVGVYITGHILETQKSWAAVFSLTSTVCYIGCIIYVLFGTGKKVV